MIKKKNKKKLDATSAYCDLKLMQQTNKKWHGFDGRSVMYIFLPLHVCMGFGIIFGFSGVFFLEVLK